MDGTGIDPTRNCGRFWAFPATRRPWPAARAVGSAATDGQVVEEIRLTTQAGDDSRHALPPGRAPAPSPPFSTAMPMAIVATSAAGNLLDGRPALQDPAYGPLLAARGYLVVLCIDVAGFGERQAGRRGRRARQGGLVARADAVRRHAGGSFGTALDYLCGRPDVDSARIGTLGISMGATHAYWLAALDKRIAAAAHLCVFSNIAGLIEAGEHDLHGIYMTVPGLLKYCDMGDVAALVAPRPQLVGVGATDPLTPPGALEPALATLRDAYAEAELSDRLTILVSPDTGHVETAEMRNAVLAFLDRSIGQSPSGRMSL